MNVETVYKWRQQLVWGIGLIVVGVVVLLQLSLIHISEPTRPY